jgi:pimeloyl-ACP methyl ester carboxylesterase
VAGAAAWEARLPLAARWRILMPHRMGCGASPPTPAEDFEADSALVAELLGEGAHLVGHSYGAVVALLAAARRPQAVWSLTTIESASTSVARGTPVVDEFEQVLTCFASAPPAELGDRVRVLLQILKPALRRTLGPSRDILNFSRRLAHFRSPMDAVIPVDTLAGAPFPKLLVSGANTPAFEAISDALAMQIGGRRLVLPGADHDPRRLGVPFNDALENILRAADRTVVLR